MIHPSHTRWQQAVTLGVLATLLSGGCGGDQETPFQVELVTSAAPQAGTCPAGAAAGLPKTGSDAVSTIRVTFYDASQGAPSADSLICERLVGAGRSEEPFYIPAARDALLHIQVQAFGPPEDATPLVASGFLANVPFADSDAGARMFLPMSGRLGCVPCRLSQPRAFHSATALPGGFALLTGGAVSVSETGQIDPTQGLRLTDRVEIFDPRSAQFVDLGPVASPRAFHAAFLLPGSDTSTARVLLVGGVGQGVLGKNDPVLLFGDGSASYPFPLTPAPGAESPPAEILVVDLTTDPPTMTSDTATAADWPSNMFPAPGVFSQGWPLVAGGLAAVDSNGSFTPLDSVDLGFDDGSHHPQSGSLATGRAAFTLTSLTPAQVLAWGGNFNQSDPTDTVAELVTVSPAPPAATPLAFDAQGSTSGPPVATAFHTATPLPDGSVLVVGGFALAGGLLTPPPADHFAYRVQVQSDSFRLETLDASGLEPVGYHAAVVLADGSVLITGGAVSRDLATTYCPGLGAPWFCAVPQAARFAPGDGFVPLPQPGLQVPRLGHAMVSLMGSGMVLVTGGIRWGEGHDGNTHLFVDGSAEVYNPEDGSASSDIPLGRTPGALYAPERQCPASWD